MISVIVPIYNAERYLGQCIDSIVAQTYTDWELLLVDDGSTDGSRDLCDLYKKKDERIRVFHKANGGVSSSRNMGLDNAKGDYITFADSDDWLEPHAFQTYIDAFNKYDVDVVRTGYYDEYEDGHSKIHQIDQEQICTNTWTMFRKTQKSLYYSFIWNTCIRCSCIDEGRFDEDISWIEDHIFLYRCYLNCRSMAILPEPTYHYVRHGTQSLSFVKDPEIVRRASQREFVLQQELINGNDKEMLKAVYQDYAYRLHHVVCLLYSGGFSYKKKKWFSANCHVITNMIYKEERIFFCRRIPFFIKEVILSTIFKMRRNKKS